MVYFFVHLLLVERTCPPAIKQMMESCLHNNDGTVHNQPEIDGTQRHQVSGNAKQVHHTESKQHGQRNDGRHNQTRSEISKDQDKDENHDQCTFEQVVFDSGNGPFHQIRTIQINGYLQTFGKHFFHFFHPGTDGTAHFTGIFTLEHQHNSTDTFAFAVDRQSPEPNGMSESHGGHIADQQWQTGLIFSDHNLSDFIQAGHQSFTSDKPGLRTFCNVSSTGIGVVVLQSVEHL